MTSSGQAISPSASGDLACTHAFMGPLTLVLTRLYPLEGGGLEACLNIRCPAGRSREQVATAARTAVEAWTGRRGGPQPGCRIEMGDPYYVESAPHVPVLVDVYRHYTGQHDAGPIAVGGGTQARLLPNGVNFGPSMPGAAYTGAQRPRVRDGGAVAAEPDDAGGDAGRAGRRVTNARGGPHCGGRLPIRSWASTPPTTERPKRATSRRPTPSPPPRQRDLLLLAGPDPGAVPDEVAFVARDGGPLDLAREVDRHVAVEGPAR